MESISMRDSMTMLVGAACVTYNSKDDGPFVDFPLVTKSLVRRERCSLQVTTSKDSGRNHSNHAYSVSSLSLSPPSSLLPPSASATIPTVCGDACSAVCDVPVASS